MLQEDFYPCKLNWHTALAADKRSETEDIAFAGGGGTGSGGGGRLGGGGGGGGGGFGEGGNLPQRLAYGFAILLASEASIIFG